MFPVRHQVSCFGDVPEEVVCLESNVPHSPEVIGEKCDIRTRITFHAQEVFYTSQCPAILIKYLEKKIQRKDEVLAELMAEHIALKKELGEL